MDNWWRLKTTRPKVMSIMKTPPGILETEDYILKDTIGSGSFSTVYKGVHKLTKKVVAIKLYKIRSNDRLNFYNTAKEVAFLRFLKHPNVIHMESFSIKREYMFLCVDYFGLGTLKDCMTTNSFHQNTESAVQKIMSQLLSAVRYLHSMYIYHGDIKPENIVMKSLKDYEIALIDFGLSDVYAELPDHEGSRSGSTFYMAPEQLLGFPFDYTCDLYSAGVVMYEIVCGAKPFKEPPRDIYFNLLKKRTPILLPQNIKLSIAGRDLMLNLLSYDKHKRYTMKQLSEHPFLSLDHVEMYIEQNHYTIALNLIIETFKKASEKSYSAALVNCIEAMFHLKIYHNILDDEHMKMYIRKKLDEYLTCAIQLEDVILYPEFKLNIPIKCQNYEHLKTLVASTPVLSNGIDAGFMGEMFHKERNFPQAIHYLSAALKELMPALKKEAPGKRKTLVGKKVAEWLKILEMLQGE